jgi:spore maturation protein CgeB
MLPVARLGIDARVHGVRYPAKAVQSLASYGIDFAGWLPNHRVAEAFASARLTIHVPRRAYVKGLPGIPTIRVFEALACGIPLISAPWPDSEGLFPEGSYLTAKDSDAMTAAISLVLRDRDLADELRLRGLRAIERQHSCAHRTAQLLDIVASLRCPAPGAPCSTNLQSSEALAQCE